jgi:lysophospholipid acyltransferase (LPLAT)-like uncharacterized protein
MTLGKRLLAPIGVQFYRIYSSTYRVQWINDELYRLKPPDRPPLIFAHWHGDDLSMIGPNRHMGHFIMISLSKDGDLLAYLMRRLGYNVLRGSTSRGGARGLIQLIRAVREGHDTIVTVDGPRGPRSVVQPGVVLLSLKTGSHILPAAAGASPRFTFDRSWSKTYLPAPFAKVIILLAQQTIAPPRSNEPEALEACRKRIEQTLIELHQRVESML